MSYWGFLALFLNVGTAVNGLFPAWVHFGQLFASTLFVITELKGVLERLMSSKWSNKQANSICMQMLWVLCRVLWSVSCLRASKTSSPSALCTEALCQSLVKSTGLPIATGGLLTWVWDRRGARCYQPLRFHQELPRVGKALSILWIKPTCKSQSIVQLWKLLHRRLHQPLSWSSDLRSWKHCLWERASHSSWNWKRLTVFVASGKKKRTGSTLTSASKLGFLA